MTEKNRTWEGLSLAKDVGFSADTITSASSLLDRVNADRPVGRRYDQTQKSEKLLTMLAEGSKHFQLDAQKELDRPVGSRLYELPAPLRLEQS